VCVCVNTENQYAKIMWRCNCSCYFLYYFIGTL